MLQLIAHLIGDYCLQNQWMANNKTSRWLPALVHALLYTLPFLLVTQSWQALAVIGLTHAIIDRYRLAKYWVRLWGIGVPGILWGRSSEPPPPFLAVWLLIIVDNTAHLAINYAAIAWL